MGGRDPLPLAGDGAAGGGAQRRLQPGVEGAPRPRLPGGANARLRRCARDPQAGRREPVAVGDAQPVPEHGIVVAARVRRPRQRGDVASAAQPADRGAQRSAIAIRHGYTRPAMAVTVRVPGPLRRLTNGSAEVSVDGATVSEALASLDGTYPGFRERLYDDAGNLRQFINIYVNDSDIRFGQGLDTPVGERDELSIVPAVAGGSAGRS